MANDLAHLSPYQRAVALSGPDSLSLAFDPALFGDDRDLLDVLRDQGTLPRQNIAGQYQIGGPIGPGDVLGAVQADPQTRQAALLAAEVAPGTGNVLAAGRLPTMYESFRDANTPIQKALRGAELGLEGLGAIGDAIPAIGAVGAAGAGLVGMMARQSDHLPALAQLARRQRGIIGSTGAKTADLAALARAEEMKAAGSSADDIFDSTGWWLDHPDGRPRFEIDDSGAVADFRQAITDEGMELGDARPLDFMLDHKAAYQAYPDTSGIDVRLMRDSDNFAISPSSGKFGEFISAPNNATDDAFRSGSLHELNHAIESREGMARGGSPDMFRPRSLKTPEDFDAWESAGEQYRRLAGESQARLVQDRMNLTPAERTADPFYKGYDVPFDDMIIRMDDGVAESVGEFDRFADDTVDGLRVGDNIPNQSSIRSSIENPGIREGVRELSLSGWGESARDVFVTTDDITRSKKLAAEIAQNGRIDPLIIGIDDAGEPYIIEGAHRMAALLELKKKSFPALVVDDMDNLPQPLPTDEASRMHGVAESVDFDTSRAPTFYHAGEFDGTGFDESGLGLHLGTEQAAIARADDVKDADRQLRKFAVNVQNPVRVDDLGTWEFQSVVRELSQQGLLDRETVDAAYDAYNKTDQQGFDVIKQALIDQGYDGLAYTNAVEDIGGESVVAFSGRQIAPLDLPTDTASRMLSRNGEPVGGSPLFIEPGFGGGKDFDALPDNTPVWVFHSTDDATAEMMIKQGVDPAGKSVNPGVMAGEVDYAPGRGAGAGLYVGGNTDDIPHGRRFLAIKTTKGNLAASPESVALGFDKPGGALNSQGAVIQGNIAPGDIVDITTGKYPKMSEIRESLTLPTDTASRMQKVDEHRQRIKAQLEASRK